MTYRTEGVHTSQHPLKKTGTAYLLRLPSPVGDRPALDLVPAELARLVQLLKLGGRRGSERYDALDILLASRFGKVPRRRGSRREKRDVRHTESTAPPRAPGTKGRDSERCQKIRTNTDIAQPALLTPKKRRQAHSSVDAPYKTHCSLA